MSALFAVLSFSELRIRILERTKGNLHVPSFLSVIGERIVDRDTTNYTKISILPSCEEHDLSERLTRALYGTLADFFNSKRTSENFIPIKVKNLELCLENVVKLFRLSYLETILASKLTSFIEFGRDFRSKGEPLVQQLVHVNFLRQGIDLTGILLTPQMCLLKKKDTLSSKPLGCVTGKLNTLGDDSVYDRESTDFNSNSFNSIFNKKSSITNKKKFY